MPILRRPARGRHAVRSGRRLVLTAVVALYIAVTSGVFILLQHNHLVPITGDEPSYLVMTSGILNDHTFDQLRPMEQEFAHPRVYPSGLAPAGTIPTLANAQVVVGPHGDFSVHNVGLPAVLVPGFALDGDEGAEIEMLLLSGLVVAAVGSVALWRIRSTPVAVAATLVSCCGLPLLAAAGQIYPDVPGGAISLVALTALATARHRRPLAVDVALAVLLAFQLWLQIKFALPAVIAAAALAVEYHRHGQLRRLAFLAGMLGVSGVLLIVYDGYAFGNVLGPYTTNDALRPGWDALMVFLGLHVDRFQGILVQCPLLVVGLVHLVRSCARRERWAVVTAAVYLSFVVPNALHPNLYGGDSLAGRFAWSGGVVLLLPTVLGLARLAETRRTVLWAVLAAEVAVQGAFVTEYTRTGFDLYNQAAQVWLGDYPSLWGRAARYLPALYDRAWAYRFAPNWAAAVLVVLLVVGAALGWRRVALGVGVLAAGAYVALAVTASAPNLTQTYPASPLPGLTGRVVGADRVATPADPVNYLTYGAPGVLQPGRYAFALRVSSSLPPGGGAGAWDVIGSPRSSPRAEEIVGGPLPGTSGQPAYVRGTFAVSPAASHWFVQIRTLYQGRGRLEVGDLTLDKLG